MRRNLLAAVLCLAGLVAGCGSAAKTATTSSSSSGSSKHTSARLTPARSAIASLLQSPATVGPPPPGTRYNAVNHGFLERLATVLGHSLESQGLHNVNVTCTASVPARAKCSANGTSGGGQSTSGTLTVMIDRATGDLRLASR
jgi:hypothetical protein